MKWQKNIYFLKIGGLKESGYAFYRQLLVNLPQEFYEVQWLSLIRSTS